MFLSQLPVYFLDDAGAVRAKRRSASSSHEEGPAMIVHLRSNAHLRADVCVAWFGNYSCKMHVCQIPIMRPETAITRSSGYQRFRKLY